MKTSEQTNELDAALSLFQGEVLPINKEKNVSMEGLSKTGKQFKVDYFYAPLDHIQEVAKPILLKHGLNVSQDLGYSFLPNGSLVHEITTRIGHKSGQWKLSVWPLDMSGVTKEQDRGVKITFNRRYAFAAALNIILTDEDTDAVGVAANGQPQQQKPQSKPQPPQAKSVNLDDPKALSEYVLQIGKNKGKKLGQIHPDELIGTSDWIGSNKASDSGFMQTKKIIDTHLAHISSKG